MTTDIYGMLKLYIAREMKSKEPMEYSKIKTFYDQIK